MSGYVPGPEISAVLIPCVNRKFKEVLIVIKNSHLSRHFFPQDDRLQQREISVIGHPCSLMTFLHFWLVKSGCLFMFSRGST